MKILRLLLVTLKDQIIEWNNAWKFDYWYRQKYKIAFNSEEHRSLSPIDIKISFMEESLMTTERDKYVQRKKEKVKYEESGQWLKRMKMPEKEEKALFDLVDFKDYGTKED